MPISLRKFLLQLTKVTYPAALVVTPSHSDPFVKLLFNKIELSVMQNLNF